MAETKRKLKKGQGGKRPSSSSIKRLGLVRVFLNVELNVREPLYYGAREGNKAIENAAYSQTRPYCRGSQREIYEFW